MHVESVDGWYIVTFAPKLIDLVKRDAAAKKLDELKDAGVNRWEKVKDGVGSAFNDLKKVFE